MAGTWGTGILLVFSKRKYKLLFFALLAILLPLYAILTDIVILLPLSFNPNLKIFEAALITAISILASLGFTIAAFQVCEIHLLSKIEATEMLGASATAGLGGSFIAAFASACAICQPVWLVWLGLGSASVFLVDYSIYIVFASLAVLLYSVHTGLKSIVECCRPKRKK